MVAETHRILAQDTTLSHKRHCLLDTYLEQITALPSVAAVYVAAPDSMTVYTVYRGSLSEVEDAIYAAEGVARDAARDVRVAFRLVPSTAEDQYSSIARRVYPHG